jgi:hypothetical protein
MFPLTLSAALLVLGGCPSNDTGDEEAGNENADDNDATAGETTPGDTGDETGDTGSTDATTDDPTTDTTTDDPTTDTTTDDPTTGGNMGAACEGAVAPAGSLAVGQQFSHWPGGFDLQGNDYDYCVLAGKPILFIMSAGWCGPCHDLAAGLAGQQSSYTGMLDGIIAAAEADELEVVEFIVDNFQDFDATALADLQMWEQMHPNEWITLIGDPTVGVMGEEPMWQYLGPVHMGGVPAGLLIDADFNVQVMGLGEALTAANAL